MKPDDFSYAGEIRKLRHSLGRIVSAASRDVRDSAGHVADSLRCEISRGFDFLEDAATGKSADRWMRSLPRTVEPIEILRHPRPFLTRNFQGQECPGARIHAWVGTEEQDIEDPALVRFSIVALQLCHGPDGGILPVTPLRFRQKQLMGCRTSHLHAAKEAVVTLMTIVPKATLISVTTHCRGLLDHVCDLSAARYKGASMDHKGWEEFDGLLMMRDFSFLYVPLGEKGFSREIFDID